MRAHTSGRLLRMITFGGRMWDVCTWWFNLIWGFLCLVYQRKQHSRAVVLGLLVLDQCFSVCRMRDRGCMSKSVYVCMLHDCELLRYVQFNSSLCINIIRSNDSFNFPAGINKVYCYCPFCENGDLQTTCGSNNAEVQEKACHSWRLRLQRVLNNATSSDSTKVCAQCHPLWAKLHNNGTDISAKAGQSAERGNASHTEDHQGHTHWDHAVHAGPPTSANQTESAAGHAYSSAIDKPHSPPHEAVKDKQRTQYCKYASWQSSSKPSKGLQTDSGISTRLCSQHWGKHYRDWPAEVKLLIK